MGCSPDVGSDNRPKGSLGARKQQEGACVSRGALTPSIESPYEAAAVLCLQIALSEGATCREWVEAA